MPVTDRGATKRSGWSKERLPDVVLLHLRVPRVDELDVVAALKSSRLPIKMIIMTTFEIFDASGVSVKENSIKRVRLSRFQMAVKRRPL